MSNLRLWTFVLNLDIRAYRELNQARTQSRGLGGEKAEGARGWFTSCYAEMKRKAQGKAPLSSRDVILSPEQNLLDFLWRDKQF